MIKINTLRALIVLMLTTITNPFWANEYKEGSHRQFGQFTPLPLTEQSTNIETDGVEEAISNVISAAEARMDSIKAMVLSQKRIVDRLDSAVFLTLPVGLTYGNKENPDGTASVEDPDYMIIIDQASIHPNYAEFSAFMTIKSPFDGQTIRFRANHIAFSFKGGLTNGFQLELVSQLRTKLSGESYLYWLPGSFVEWDCKGFKSLGINAQVELSEKRFKKVDPKTGKELGKVSTKFFIAADQGLNNLVVSLYFDPFKIKGFDEACFSFNTVVLDFSDTRNAPGFKLPEGYPGGYVGDKAKLWRGFYVKEAEIVLSKKFDDKDGKQTLIYANDIILDDFGLTGTMGAEDPLTLDKGKLGNWRMSISHFEMEFYTGTLKRLELNGGVVVSGTSTPMNYEASYDSDGNYHFGINPANNLQFNVFSAEVNLDATSRIDVWVEQGKFLPAATLNGDISFKCAKNSSSKSTLVTIPNIEFQGLRIAAKPPVFDVKYVALASRKGDPNFNKFPIVIRNIKFEKTEPTLAVFSFELFVNLVPSETLDIQGDTRLGIAAKIDDGNWSYDGIRLQKISVSAKKEGAFELSGSVTFVEGDPVYGKGFRGEIEAIFAKTFELKAVAIFGKVDGYRYFFVDAFVGLGKSGIPAGPFTLNGFGGGMYMHMRQANEGEPAGEMGKSLSGVAYKPDQNVFFGIKACVAAGIVNPSVISAKVSFEISFTKDGGIAQIIFQGEASMLKPPFNIPPEAMKALAKATAGGEEPKVEPSAMTVKVLMRMDFQNHIFHNEMEMFLNIAGVITGIGDNNRAGWGVMHIEPDKWYLHIGTPTDPVGLNFIGIMKVGSYFMAGHDIPDAMMMNPKVLEILDMTNEDFNGQREEGELFSGKGLAFGANFELDTGDLTFLIFYARFQLGGGFDIMLLDYGKDVYCKGRSGPPGINGWYAKGQAYAYFAGKIGINVKIFGKKKTYDIIDLQMAFALRMEGPNPTWMMGVVGGKYQLLGGMIKGNCKFQAEVGEKCEMRHVTELSDLEIIADLTPADSTKDVDLFAMPQAVFNMPVDKVIRISDDPSLTKTFKINLVEYAVYNEDSTRYPGEIEWNDDKTSLAYRMHEIFYSNTKYRVVAKVSFDEQVDGKWQAYKGDDGKVYYETKEATFTTGALPEKIPNDAIKYSYPLSRMVNFYKQEYDKAYVGFNPGVAPFFEKTEGYTQKARWTQVNGSPFYTDVKYDKGTRRVETQVPAGLNNDKIYHFELVHVPLGDGSVDSNVTEQTTNTLGEGNEGTADITTRQAEGTISDGEEKAFYSIAFRCSKYNKFFDKIPQNELNVRFLYNVSPAIDMPGATVYGDEMFDYYEIEGHGGEPPLIKREAVLETADWYQANFNELIYKDYPFRSETQVSWRNTASFGIPPTKTIDLWQIDYNYLLTDQDIESGTINMEAEMTHFIYTLSQIWANDYADIRNKIANLVDKGGRPDARMQRIMNKYPWPQVSKGNYPIRLSYVLPGINQVTSTKVVNLRNNIEVKQVNLLEN